MNLNEVKKEMTDLQSIFDNWDNVPVEIKKKKIARKRKEAIDKYQGTLIVKDPKYTATA